MRQFLTHAYILVISAVTACGNPSRSPDAKTADLDIAEVEEPSTKALQPAGPHQVDYGPYYRYMPRHRSRFMNAMMFQNFLPYLQDFRFAGAAAAEANAKELEAKAALKRAESEAAVNEARAEAIRARIEDLREFQRELEIETNAIRAQHKILAGKYHEILAIKDKKIVPKYAYQNLKDLGGDVLESRVEAIPASAFERSYSKGEVQGFDGGSLEDYIDFLMERRQTFGIRSVARDPLKRAIDSMQQNAERELARMEEQQAQLNLFASEEWRKKIEAMETLLKDDPSK